jgi:quercetin dioxygenase-like cupin family protein
MGVVHKRSGEGPFFQWDGVAVEGYRQDGNTPDGPTKQVLISEADGAPNFALRYFTIPVGQTSNLDYHEHDHGVVIMHGRARVMLGERYEEVAEGDVVYIPGWERHQFENTGDTPLTFLCIIPPKKADACVIVDEVRLAAKKQG